MVMGVCGTGERGPGDIMPLIVLERDSFHDTAKSLAMTCLKSLR